MKLTINERQTSPLRSCRFPRCMMRPGSVASTLAADPGAVLLGSASVRSWLRILVCPDISLYHRTVLGDINRRILARLHKRNFINGSPIPVFFVNVCNFSVGEALL